jgi:hypothetical protein
MQPRTPQAARMDGASQSVAALSALSANCPRTPFPTASFLQIAEFKDEMRSARLASHLLNRWRGRIGETLRQGTEKA